MKYTPTDKRTSTNRFQNRGFAIVESLVAICLVGIAMVGVTSLYVTSFNSNATARSYAAVESDVATIIDGYRVNTYTQLLQKFGSAPTDITNGQTVTENVTGSFSKANYVTTLTAIKSSNGATPEAIQVHVVATQRRGALNTAQYVFETIVAPTS